MPKDVNRTVIAPNLEVTVRGVKPSVEDLGDCDGTRTEPEVHRLFVGAMPCIALDLELEGISAHGRLRASPSPEFGPFGFRNLAVGSSRITLPAGSTFAAANRWLHRVS